MKPQARSTCVQLPHPRKSCSLIGSFTALAAGLALFGGQPSANAQALNFDAGNLTGFTELNFNPALVVKSFPDNGSGKAFKIIAHPIPDAAPAAEAILSTPVYTDFYVALDIVNWAVVDQAVVLLGRWTGGLADGTGMILNYDVAQDGDKAGDRKGGQLQINTITEGFETVTLAAADITFEPGHSYRLILKAVGSIYTGQAYDLNDLTKPLVTFSADDTVSPSPVVSTSGKCGVLSFSRDDTAGSTDVTIDNFYAAAADPNTAIAPAIHPSLFTDSGTGVPQVTSRTPAKRFSNFQPTTGGSISFTAQTFTADLLNNSATKLYLNNALFATPGAGLTTSADAATIAYSTTIPLVANTLYSARIEVETVPGLKGTNTFWFDTFSDAFLKTSPVKTVEAEDYNYSGTGGTPSGLWISSNPIPVSGVDSTTAPINQLPAGYYDGLGNFAAVQGIDYFRPAGSANEATQEYRTQDKVQITQGSYMTLARDEAGDIVDFQGNLPPQRINDTQRSQYLAAGTGGVLEYQVRLTSPGDWMNYTRDFTATNYNVYLRCASFGDTTVYLDQVTSDPTTTNQTTVRFGSFNVDNHIMRLNYKYEPLMSGSSPAVVSLAGIKTLRLTLGGTVTKDDRLVVLDYLVFVPTSDSPTLIYPSLPPTVFDNFNDGNDTTPPWQHYDPLTTAGVPPPATYTFPDGHYRILAPAPLAPDAGPARAGSFLKNEVYTDFYVSADLIDFDDTVRQAFGVTARITTPGLQTTGGYLFSWEPGSGALPGETNGDLDISRLIGETPVGQIETAPSGLHLTKGKSYRFVFMGSGTNFEGQVYELPDTTNPLIRLPANDPDNMYPSGQVGLIVASQGDDAASPVIPGDATWDNFLATTAEPRLTVSVSGGSVVLNWPFIPYRLQSSPSLSSPVWTDVTTGITLSSGHYVYSAPATDSGYFRLSYP
ncbi:MAG: hypothetical protein IT579_08670 [Verrucomicrobia subdivision 3 bacterium]|nr:hypothetical protein [Limisphaerales bacterium]